MAEGGEEAVPPEEDTEDNFVDKRGGTSVIWNWFGFDKKDSEQRTVMCKVCKVAVKTTGANTTNLFYHLKHKHRVEYEQCVEKRRAAEASKSTFQPRFTQPKIQHAFAYGSPYDKKSKRWKELTDALSYYLAKDMMPLYSVEKEGFNYLLHKFDPRYTMPSRKYFTKTAIPQMYQECRELLQSTLATVDFFATTSDMWSSRATEPYISLTIHYVTSDWTLNSSCLQTSFFPEEHTGENIAHQLKEFLTDWDLDETKQVCVTTDSGANIVKAAAMNEWTRLPCFGHALHCAIGKPFLFFYADQNEMSHQIEF